MLQMLQITRIFEELKQIGNECFAYGRYSKAIDHYSKGLELNHLSVIPGHKSLCN